MRRVWMIALMLALASNFVRAQQTSLSTDSTPPAAQPAKEKANPPRLINHVVPQYPEEARRTVNQGLCLVSIIVDLNGFPQDMKIVRCTFPAFAQSSLDAVSQYRFEPATNKDGKPVAVKINVEIDYHLYGGVAGNLSVPVRCLFSSPPGTTSPDPGPDGVYPLTKMTTSPIMTKFSDEGYGELAFRSAADSSCNIVLSISEKGKPYDPHVTHCASSALEKPAVSSLLKSKFKPGKFYGKAVPVQVSIHLEYAGSAPVS